MQTCAEFFRHQQGSLKVVVEAPELLGTVESALLALQELEKTNQELLGIEAANWPNQELFYLTELPGSKITGYSFDRLYYGNGGQQGYGSPADAQRFTSQILPNLIKRQQGVLTAVKAGNLYPHVFCDGIDYGRPWGQLTFSRTFEGTHCSDCGHIQASSSLKSHQLSLKCMQAAHDRDLREAGWKQVEASHHGMAIRRAGVQWDIRAAEFKMWVPAWVDEAIKQYEKNKGYGGLKLDAFLAKMKPNEPK